MKINKIIAKGLILTILLGSISMSSFASEINLKENKLETKNTVLPEISPQMLSIITSIAVGAGITLTTDDDIYNIGRLFYDYIQRNNQLTWDIVKTTFASAKVIKDNILINSDILSICNGFFDDTFKNVQNDINFINLWYLPYFKTNADAINYSNSNISFQYNDDYYKKDFSYGGINFKFDSVSSNGSCMYYLLTKDGDKRDLTAFKYGTYYTMSLSSRTNGDIDINLFSKSSPTSSIVYSGIASYSPYALKLYFDVTIGTFSYTGGYDWDSIENNLNEDGSIGIYIPSNVSSLVGQVGGSTINDGVNNPSYDLINPCAQEIIIPEVNNPSINIGESVKIQTDANCSIYNIEQSVQKAEQSKDPTDIEDARDLVNNLPESSEKEELQNRLDTIVPNISLERENATNNLDVYIKSENSLHMALDTNSIIFEDYTGVDDLTLNNAIQISINSSLPYDLNAYLLNEMYDSTKTNKIDIDRLNIKDNSNVIDADYKEFTSLNTKLILKGSCDAGNDKTHNIDLKLKGGNAYPADIYKTVIKFEAEQK